VGAERVALVGLRERGRAGDRRSRLAIPESPGEGARVSDNTFLVVDTGNTGHRRGPAGQPALALDEDGNDTIQPSAPRAE